MEKEMLTVKEWAKKSGLTLDDYDGFLDVYEKLSGAKTDTILEHSEARFRDAGELVCSREAFETHVSGCSMKLPNMEEMDFISDVIPHFVEHYLNLKLAAFIGSVRHGMIAQEDIKKEFAAVLDAIAKKLGASVKSMKMYKLEEVNIALIPDDELKREVDRVLSNRAQTVEEAEKMLSRDIAELIESARKEENITIPKTLINRLQLLTSLFYHSARSRKVYGLSNDFMLVSSPINKKEDLIVPYNIIDGEKIEPGVVFDIDGDEAHVQGTMPITEDAKDKLAGEIGNKIMQ